VALKSRSRPPSSRCISRTAPRWPKTICCSRSTAVRSTPRSNRAEGTLAKDQAQLEGAQRDLRRFTDLVGKGATTQVNVDNAKTQCDILTATIKADQAALDNLKVQKSYTLIRAPFAGRISAANVKVGNFVRPADLTSLAVINQMAPVMLPSRFHSACWSICGRRWPKEAPA